MRRLVAFLLAGVSLAAAGPTFEIVSIKPFAADGSPMPAVKFDMIGLAVPAQGGRVTGGPITANALILQAFRNADGPLRLAALPGMLRAVLEERFKLKAHLESRLSPVYALVKTRSDGRLGAAIHASSFDCDGFERDQQERITQLSRDEFIAKKMAMGSGHCSTSYGPGRFDGHDTTMKALAAALGVDRPVLDRTGLVGRFDIELRWTPPASSSPDGASAISDGPSVFTALQEQLGLKLERSEEPMDVLVIDHIEPPTPN